MRRIRLNSGRMRTVVVNSVPFSLSSGGSSPDFFLAAIFAPVVIGTTFRGDTCPVYRYTK